MHEKVEEEGKWRTFRGERYTVRFDTDSQTLELHANDGRGLVLSSSQGQISSQLSLSDIEHLNQIDQQIEQYLAQVEGQRQVDCCVPVLVRYLNWLGRYRDENANRLVEFDPDPKILTYRSKTNLEDFLVAKRTQEGWEYLEGQLTPEREKALSVDFERSLRQKEKEKDKERNRGFGR